jgi:replicative DNA helicase
MGGIDYLQSINDMSVTDKNFDVYLKEVLEASTKYKLYEMAKTGLEDMAENAKSGKNSEDLIGQFELGLIDLSSVSRAIEEPRNLADGLEELLEERRNNPVKQMGIATGYQILDKQIDGLVPGTLTVVAARPKMGKSTFLSNIAAHVAYKGEPKQAVLYVDTEMSFDQWRDRIIAGMSGYKERDIKHGGYDDEMYHRIKTKCVKLIKEGKLFHEYMPGYNVDKLTALYKKYKLKHDIGLMIFDYIKEPESSSLDRQRREYQILGDVTTRLKDLAGQLDIPCLTAVQLNRDKDIADSDRIARYADIICQWTFRDDDEKDAKPDSGSHKIMVKETRRGGMTPKEGIGYYFWKESLFIEEVPASQQLVDYSKEVINYGSASDDEEDRYQ